MTSSLREIFFLLFLFKKLKINFIEDNNFFKLSLKLNINNKVVIIIKI